MKRKSPTFSVERRRLGPPKRSKWLAVAKRPKRQPRPPQPRPGWTAPNGWKRGDWDFHQTPDAADD